MAQKESDILAERTILEKFAQARGIQELEYEEIKHLYDISKKVRDMHSALHSIAEDIAALQNEYESALFFYMNKDRLFPSVINYM